MAHLASEHRHRAPARSTVRRGVIAALVVALPGDLHRLLPRVDRRPLHGAQTTAASVVAPVQEVADRAPCSRSATPGAGPPSLRDARDRAAAPGGRERGAARAARRQRRARPAPGRARASCGVESPIDPDGLGGYKPRDRARSSRARSPTGTAARASTWARPTGVVRNSPVRGRRRPRRGPGGRRHRRDRRDSSRSTFITDGRTEVGATIPEAGNSPGLLQSTTARPAAADRRAARGARCTATRPW